jgi:hypothetical protein
MFPNPFQRQTLRLLQVWLEGGPAMQPELDQWVGLFMGDEPLAADDNQGRAALAGESRHHQHWLDRQGLTPIFAQLLSQHPFATLAPEVQQAAKEVWRKKRQAYLARSLHLEVAARAVTAALDAWGGPWAFTKGFPLARRVYDQPYMRPSNDIDILVPPEHLRAALAALYAIGGQDSSLTIQPHEQALVIRGIHIDVHNAPMRKGRLRCNPTAEWLSKTERTGLFPGLSEHDELVLSLVHPAVTEYLITRAVRILDIAVQIRRNRERPDWPRLAADIRRLGLANAAFATALQANHLCASQNNPLIPERFLESLQVGGFRRRYWRWWLDRHPDRLYSHSPSWPKHCLASG